MEFIDEQIKIEESIAKSENEGHPISHQYGANCMNVVKKFVHEVLEEYNGGWIPCSERLPEKNGMYLCTQNSYDLATNKNIIRVSTELVEFYNGKWRRAKNLVITHWQPLPKPFKERD